MKIHFLAAKWQIILTSMFSCKDKIGSSTGELKYRKEYDVSVFICLWCWVIPEGSEGWQHSKIYINLTKGYDILRQKHLGCKKSAAKESRINARVFKTRDNYCELFTLTDDSSKPPLLKHSLIALPTLDIGLYSITIRYMISIRTIKRFGVSSDFSVTCMNVHEASLSSSSHPR